MSFNKKFLWGEVPDGWRIEKLSNLTNYISRGKQPKYVEKSDIKVLNQKAIRWHSIEQEHLKYHDPNAKVDQRHFIQKDDVVLNSTGTGTLGRVYHFKESPNQMFADSHVTIIRTDKEKLNPRFFMYQISDKSYQDFILSSYISGSTGQVEFNKSKVQELLIQLPPIEEQNAIVSVLSSLDDKIELNNRINKTLEEMAQAIFKSWFVDFEPFRDGEFVESELGMIPKGWEVISLGDFVEIRTRSIDPQKYPDQTFEHYSIPAFDNAKLPVFEKGSEIKSNKYMIDKNSILVSKLNPSQKRVWYPVCLTDGAICSTEFINYRAKEAKFTDFLYSLVNSYRFSEFMIEHATGSTNSRQRVAPKQTLEFKFPIPCESILLSFSKLVKPIYQQINKNLLESKTLKILRDTLLPKLMSGEIRVPLD